MHDTLSREILAAERRGRAVAQRVFIDPDDQWDADISDTSDGFALMAAARAAESFGAKVTLRLHRREHPSALWPILSESCRRLGATEAAGNIPSRAVILHGNSSTDVITDFPDDDAAWRVSLADSSVWVSEVAPAAQTASCAESREIDRRAIEDFAVPGICLMENAAIGATAIARDMLPGPTSRLVILVGGGNNGGDGLVMARGLAGLGHIVSVLMLKTPQALRGDAAINVALLQGIPGITLHQMHDDASILPQILSNCDLVVDGLLGTGFTKNLSIPFAHAITAVNASGRPTLALDLPSGMNGDTGEVTEVAIIARRTVTFAVVKRGLATPGAARYTGKLFLAHICSPKGT